MILLGTNNIIIENRVKTSISGVTDVVSFSEHEIVLDTESGGLVLQGEDFRINKLNVDIGELTVDGKLNFFSYETPRKEKVGMLTRIFR